MLVLVCKKLRPIVVLADCIAACSKNFQTSFVGILDYPIPACLASSYTLIICVKWISNNITFIVQGALVYLNDREYHEDKVFSMLK